MLYVEHFMKIQFVRIFIILILSILNAACADLYIVKFHNAVCIKPHQDYHYQTCHSITVTIDDFILEIPKNFDNDIAAIPRWLWSFIAPSKSEFIAPAILHDFLYTCHYGYTRKEADEIFLSALLDNDVSRLTAYEMYAAVRIFGQSHFDEDGSCSDKLDKNEIQYGTCETV